MDTGFVNLINANERTEVLKRAARVCGDFVAGVYLEPNECGRLADRYIEGMRAIADLGGTPILFQCAELAELPGNEQIDVYRRAASAAIPFLAFELSPRFAPFGRIYDLQTIEQLITIPECIGIKHSSLQRQPEWDRIALRDRLRPEFKIYTGNDLAIDMVQYGSDYLLGLSTFAPDFFALRDSFWASGDNRFYELNDTLQYLGNVAFRDPVPAYKHSAAQFLKLRGWIASDNTHPDSPSRPESDLPILQEILGRLSKFA